jgi:hypothetical protein
MWHMQWNKSTSKDRRQRQETHKMKRTIATMIVAAMIGAAVPAMMATPATAATRGALVTVVQHHPATNSAQDTSNGLCVSCGYDPVPKPDPNWLVAVSFGWVIYVHFSHRALGGALLEGFVGGAAAGLTWLCSTISIGYLVPACMVIAGFLAAYFLGVIDQAYNEGRSIVFEFTYALSYFGYLIVPNSWT